MSSSNNIGFDLILKQRDCVSRNVYLNMSLHVSCIYYSQVIKVLWTRHDDSGYFFNLICVLSIIVYRGNIKQFCNNLIFNTFLHEKIFWFWLLEEGNGYFLCLCAGMSMRKNKLNWRKKMLYRQEAHFYCFFASWDDVEVMLRWCWGVWSWEQSMGGWAGGQCQGWPVSHLQSSAVSQTHIPIDQWSCGHLSSYQYYWLWAIIIYRMAKFKSAESPYCNTSATSKASKGHWWKFELHDTSATSKASNAKC